MILGLPTTSFTLLHVALSLVGILAGLVVVAGILRGRLPLGWNALFLVTTILTSVTGFFFLRNQVLPSHVVGGLSLLVLLVALLALYRYRLEGAWRRVYAITALVALYLNVFVAVAQAFLKIRFLSALAPTQSDPAFIVAQVAVLAAFLGIGVLAFRSCGPARVALSAESRA
jgi:hypothetical protein